ncbi:phosphate acyltransferase PlsX [candidate division KSB1 bacterium]|nr:phosphate acyltransferase PlsX [candidate division KSB1 bacterium]
MRIAVDAMGGDKAPEAIVSGAIEAARIAKGRFEVVLVGDEEKIEACLQQHRFVKGCPVSVAHASECIEMNESPAKALRKKPDSSIAVAMGMHSQGKVNAVVSAGNTGAVLGSALFTLKRIEGVLRPAVGSFLPHEDGVCFLIDAGSNVDCKPEQLVQFGIMGSIFFKHVMDIEMPRVGLLNIGEEPGKGNEQVQAAYPLFEKTSMNFVGNIEGRDILSGQADVIVCDGFVGNTLIKFGESLARMLPFRLRRTIGTNIAGLVGHFLIQPKFSKMLKIFDYQEYGGAPLLGVKGNCIIAHGRSTPRAIRTAIAEAWKMVNENVASHIAEQIHNLKGDE